MRITKPRPGEGIYLMVRNNGAPKYRAVVDVPPKPGRSRGQQQKTFATIKEARDWQRETRTAIARGSFVPAARMTLRGLAEDWLASRLDIRERSREGYQSALRPVLVRLGNKQVQKITRRDIEGLVSWMVEAGGIRGGGLGHRSVVYSLLTVRMVLDYGVASGLLGKNPASGVKPPRRAKGDRPTLTVWEPADLTRFREAADRDEWAALWRLSLCGLRRSEVMGLAWSSVDLDAGLVRVEQGRVTLRGGKTATDDAKSGASNRTVAVETMLPGTVALLRALKARQAADRLAAGSAYEAPADGTGLLLLDPLGRPIQPDQYGKRFQALCVAAGVPKVRLHALRHSLALMLHRAGAAPADVASLLGHRLSTHLQFYVPTTERGAASAAATFGAVLAVGG